MKLPLCAMCGKPIARSGSYMLLEWQTKPVMKCGWHTKCALTDLACPPKGSCYDLVSRLMVINHRGPDRILHPEHISRLIQE